MKSLNINHLSGLKENMLITTSDKLTSPYTCILHMQCQEHAHYIVCYLIHRKSSWKWSSSRLKPGRRLPD